MFDRTLKIGIVGAAGYAGAELLRLCSGHRSFEVVIAAADTNAGKTVGDLYPGLASVCGDMRYGTYDLKSFCGLDAVFLAMPNMSSTGVASELMGNVGCVVDLGADFRLRDPELYDKWYDVEHMRPELIDRFVYGLAELSREELTGADGIAVAGCYPVAATLGIVPFMSDGHVSADGVIVDAASGVSGAGRTASEGTSFCGVDGDFRAYGVTSHRHTPEIEQASGCEVLFTAHLAPMSRGILATCYMRPTGAMTTKGAIGILREFYDGEPFVRVSEGLPHTKAVVGSNSCHLSARVDSRTGWLVAISAIDNLVKGAAGNAIQCANIALGVEETEGLPRMGLTP